MGNVDSAGLQRGNVTTFELQGTQLKDASGVEFEIDAVADSIISLSDSFVNAAGRDPRSSISFKVFGHRSSPLRVMLDNCPQWYGLRGRQIYLHHDSGIVVRALRTLTMPGTATGVPLR